MTAARTWQSERMRRPRSAGAVASTGTYAAPAFMMPKSATTAGRALRQHDADAIAVRATP